MRKDRGLLVMAAAAGLAASAAQAQFDTSVWPGFSGGAKKQRSALNVAGPAVNLAFAKKQLATVSPGGMSVGSDGSIYFKTPDLGNRTGFVYRLNPDGSVAAQSPDIGGGPGSHGGVVVGADAVYACVRDRTAGLENTKIAKLDKSTLAVIATFTDAAFKGLAGTPVIGSALNSQGHVNLYVHDRDGNAIHAVDSVTGAVQWTHLLLPSTVFFSQLGPMWTDGGRDVVAYFANDIAATGTALKDNGDGTFTSLWDPFAAGPTSFNWWGSGAMSADGDNIYVTTFNDGDVPTLWSVSVATGSVLASVPGKRGICGEELNFFGRPAVLGNRVYCGGGQGVIACFEDQGNALVKLWEYRDFRGEHTAISAVRNEGGEVYVYAVKQEVTPSLDPINDPCGAGGLNFTNLGEFVALRDDGVTYTEMLKTTLNDTMRFTLFSNSSATVDGDGSVWVAGGRTLDALGAGDIYKFSVETGGCGCVCNYDTSTGPDVCDFFDFITFQDLFAANDPCGCELDTSTGQGVCDFFDFIIFQDFFSAGC